MSVPLAVVPVGVIAWGIGGLVGGLVSRMASRYTTDKQWSQAARRLGLEFRESGLTGAPEIIGLLDGVDVHVSVASGSAAKKRGTYYQIRHRPVGPSVTLARAYNYRPPYSVFSKNRQRFDDVEIGDPLFDKQVVVDTTEVEAIREFLTPARRAAVLQLFETWRDARVTYESIQVEVPGIVTEASKIERDVRQLVSIAVVLADPDPVNRVLAQRDEGQFVQSMQELETLNQSRDNAFTGLLEVEAHLEDGDHDAASQALNRVDAALVAALDGGWRDLATLPNPPALPLPAALPPVPTLPLPPEGADEGARSLAQQAVIDDLFAGRRSGAGLIDQFEAVYRLARVTWAGEVTSVHTYRSDRDFPGSPGVKAIVLLGGAGQSELVSNEVHAVVQLPEGATVSRAMTLRFTGLLVKADRFARMLYIEQGHVDPI